MENIQADESNLYEECLSRQSFCNFFKFNSKNKIRDGTIFEKYRNKNQRNAFHTDSFVKNSFLFKNFESQL